MSRPDEFPAASMPTRKRRRRRSVKPTGDLADARCPASQLRCRQPRTRMPRRSASISNRRASRWPASSPSARSSPTARIRRPLPVDLLRRRCSSAASSASFAAIRCRQCRAPAASGRTPSRSPRSSTRTCKDSAVGKRLVLPCQARLAGLAPDARRVARQSRLLSLERFRDPILCFVLGWPAMASASDSRLFRRCSADRRRSRARCDPPVLPARPVRDVRSAAAERPPRRPDGDRCQGRN